MSKSSKTKTAKVPKLTETQYAEYISRLKGEEPTPKEATKKKEEKPCS